MKRFIYLIISILALLCSCEDAVDNYRYPSVISDFACLVTDGNGQPELLRLDNGQVYPISFSDEYDTSSTYSPDTVYRVIGIYELGADNTAHVYSMSEVLSLVPIHLNEGEVLKQAPSFLQSCWLSGAYLNMTIELKALNSMHIIGFVDTTPKDMQGKEFCFYHDANGDIESHRRKLYASIPLSPFASELHQGDTLRLVINEYDKGITRYEFVL